MPYSKQVKRCLLNHLGSLSLSLAAPETQHKSVCSVSSDLFSLGMLMVALFNGGQSLIQANHSASSYFKQAGTVRELITVV